MVHVVRCTKTLSSYFPLESELWKCHLFLSRVSAQTTEAHKCCLLSFKQKLEVGKSDSVEFRNTMTFMRRYWTNKQPIWTDINLVIRPEVYQQLDDTSCVWRLRRFPGFSSHLSVVWLPLVTRISFYIRTLFRGHFCKNVCLFKFSFIQLFLSLKHDFITCTEKHPDCPSVNHNK